MEDLTRRAQVPDPLRRLDDPWGLSWRTWNALARFSARRLILRWWAWVRGVSYERPIFVLGAPRSGTTFVFHLLREHSSLGSLPGEGHDIWRARHHPRRTGWRSDAVAADDVGRGERRAVCARFYPWVGTRRLLDKTPENSLRIGYLRRLFPDACLVVVWRRPADVVSSLINAWRDPSGRFRSYYVPEDLDIEGYPARRRWCFALVEGWRELARASVPEIAFEQWRQCVEGIESGRRLAPERFVDVDFEKLLERPEAEASRLCEALSLEWEPDLAAKLSELLRRPVNATSPPGEQKWRRDNEAEVTPLLPRMAAVARELGMGFDIATGSWVRE